MFQPIRTRLLVSSLIVFALVLGGFAGVVRLVFWRNLQQQLTDRLTTVGQSAAASVEYDGGQIKVEDDLSIADLQRQQQALQWFDRQGNLIEQQGDVVLTLPLDPQALAPQRGQGQAGGPAIQAVTLPILNGDSGEQIGYVRVSQSLAQLDDTLDQLDWGLMVGVLVGLGMSGGGILWITRQAMEPIEASFQRLKQFTADASHELRSPLMAISSNVEVALKYPEGIREEDREVFASIASATAQMTRLTEDLLLLARSDRPREPVLDPHQPALVKAPIDLSTLLRDLVTLYQPQAQASAIALHQTIAPDLTLGGEVDPITRALTNLIQNALQYTPAGGQVWVEAKALNQQIHITVQDSGMGIAPEHLQRVFERFWRADAARTHDRGGSGLGLAITQAIVQRHGGTLAVTSQLKTGSCFQVQLPMYGRGLAPGQGQS